MEPVNATALLTARQWQILEAAVDRIIPEDEFPSGWQAGVGDYLARLLATDARKDLPLYRDGLDSLDREAERWGGGFVESPPDTRDSVLRLAEFGVVAREWPVDPKRFFALLVRHAMEGFYGDPGNGGNRDGVSWRMVGFEVTA